MISGERVELIQKQLSVVLELGKKPLITRSEWGTITFQGGEKDFGLISSLASYLSKLPIDYFTDQAATDLENSLEQSKRVLSNIDAFRLEDGDPAARVDGLLTELRNTAYTFMEQMRPWIPFLAYQKGDVQENITKLESAQQAAKKIVDALDAFSSNSQEQFNKILSATREASASAGVGVFTEDFAKQATTAAASASRWLSAAIILSCLTLLSALTFYLTADPNVVSDKVAIYLLLNKVLIFSVLISASFWASQIYKATRHQQIVNEHRANALRTFQAFVQATSDEQTRNAVLLETTRSIFSFSQSGFVSTQDQPDGLKVLEFFKGTAGK